MSGLATGAPSRTARPATISSPGMAVPGAKASPAPDAATATRRPVTASSSHSTEMLPPSNVRIPSAMWRPTLARSRDCTRAWPTAESAAASRRADCSRAMTAACSRSMLRRSVRSRSTSTAPSTAPSGSKSRAPLSSTGRSCPSWRTRRRPGRGASAPSRTTRAAGLSTGARVSSDSSGQISGSGRPRASSAVRPVRRSAAPFMNRTRPATSVTTTASAMLASVTASSSRCSRSRASARRRPAAAAQMPTQTSTNIPVRTQSCPWVSKTVYCTSSARAVASRPGRAPPYHALRTTAASSRNSCERSIRGSESTEQASAAATARIATA